MNTILIVDDNKDNIITASAIIKGGFIDAAILEADSGKECLRIVDENSVDLILLDVHMPEMNGIETCSRLRFSIGALGVPVILITAAHTTPEERARGLNSGAEAFLSKPIDPIELVAQAKALLRLKKAEDRLQDKMLLLNDLVDQKTKSLSHANNELQREIEERKCVEVELRKLSTRLVDLREEERKHLAVELHDRIGQNLTAQGINISLALEHLENQSSDIAIVRERLNASSDLLESITDEIRDITTNLHPSILDDSGLMPALEWYAKQFSEMMNVEVQFSKPVKKIIDLPSKTCLTFFRIAQEAMNNAIKHASPKMIEIDLSQPDDNVLALRIQDDGEGFDTFKSFNLTENQTLGIIGMKERAYSINAEFEMDSSPEQGTTVTITVNLDDTIKK